MSTYVKIEAKPLLELIDAMTHPFALNEMIVAHNFQVKMEKLYPNKKKEEKVTALTKVLRDLHNEDNYIKDEEVSDEAQD